ncbi:MAG: hypothetical protein WC399_01260 [Bacilli bacterium]|jgi:hypothetical protein
MKNNKRIAIAAATFGIAALAMGGSTFAWFQVANTANLALEGTVVGVDNNLDVGFKTTNPVDGFAALGLDFDGELSTVVASPLDPEAPVYPDEYEDFVYWAPHSVNSGIMAAVIEASGFNSSNILNTITSGSFDRDAVVAEEILPLYLRPEFDANRTERYVAIDSVAPTTSYVGFSILFRALDEELEGVETAIYFDEGTQVAASKNAVGALRVGFDNGIRPDIIKPSAVAADSIAVGGVMDLNGDGANDYTLQQYDEVTALPLPLYEVAYGEFDEVLVNGDWDDEAEDAGVTPSRLSNDKFYEGETATGVNAFLSGAKALTADFNTFAAYSATGTPIATTDDTTGIAEVDFMMWLEGWDLAAVNSISNAKVGAALAFIAPDLY